MRISVIIPTLNEAAGLAETIWVLRERTSDAPVEVIVADCGSDDRTRAIAVTCGATVQTGPPPTSRAEACNAGAAAATGDVLMFLHADSRVPERYDALIRETLADPGVVGGAFEFKLDGPQRRLRIVEWIDRWRYRLRGRFYGDQGIFVRRETFERLGGFPTIGILEDAHFCAAAKRLGAMRLRPEEMLTSPRRFYAGGILTTLAFDILIVMADLLGLAPERFAGVYRRDNERRGSHVCKSPLP